MSGDDRFSSMHSASTFKKSKKDSFKVKVDDRFKTLLTDERFQSVHGQVDQYGRKVKNKGNQEKVANEMKQFYEIEQDNDAAQSAGSSKPKFSQSKKDNKASGVDRLEYLNKLARGEISDEESSSDSDDASASTSSDSSEEDEDSSDESGSSDDDRRDIKSKTKVQKSALAIPDQEEPELVADVSSSRIAIQNCDWENLSAEDIMVVLQSFCPPGSTNAVRSVTVYISDFGKKRMELEARYGPQGIWKVQEEEPDENDEDLYDHIVAVDDEGGMEVEGEGIEEGSDGSASPGGDSGSDSEGSEEEPLKRSTKAVELKINKKAVKKGDFVRRNGAVGIVLHDDLKKRGVSSKYKSAESEEDEDEEKDNSQSDDDSEGGDGSEDGGQQVARLEKGKQGNKESKKDTKKKVKDGEGFDEVALRRYELSKLRYYFAVAECDCARTANMLYEELDGVEMESSAMVFDLSLVPEDLQFTDREVRDTYRPSASGAVNPNYKPPDFVVNALQHTKVQCSWDEGEKLRDRQLSNFSSWRNLNESELQQYVADSDSSDSEISDVDCAAEEAKEGKGGKEQKKAAQRKQQKAALMRKMLLGDDAENGDDGSDASQDDFFQDADAGDDDDKSGSGDDGSDDDDGMYGSDADVPAGFSDAEDGEGKTLTYLPELGKDLLAKKRGQVGETPYEIEQRKMAEKKKARKLAKKAYQEAQEAEKKASLQSAKEKKHAAAKGKGAAAIVVLTDEQRKKQAALELLFEDDTGAAEDFDMRKVEQAEIDKSKGKKGNKRKKAKQLAEDVPVDDFKLDVSDDRFTKLFEGDSNFGIDKTSTEYRATSATQEILNEQAKRRARKEQQREAKSSFSQQQSAPSTTADAKADNDSNVDSLVNKLKRKFAKA